ncbi:hypothetical protein C0J52_23482, partial [Blattella germanica]
MHGSNTGDIKIIGNLEGYPETGSNNEKIIIEVFNNKALAVASELTAQHHVPDGEFPSITCCAHFRHDGETPSITVNGLVIRLALCRMVMERMQHLPYSPDLSPCEYDLIQKFAGGLGCSGVWCKHQHGRLEAKPNEQGTGLPCDKQRRAGDILPKNFTTKIISTLCNGAISENRLYQVELYNDDILEKLKMCLMLAGIKFESQERPIVNDEEYMVVRCRGCVLMKAGNEKNCNEASLYSKLKDFK